MNTENSFDTASERQEQGIGDFFCNREIYPMLRMRLAQPLTNSFKNFSQQVYFQTLFPFIFCFLTQQN